MIVLRCLQLNEHSDVFDRQFSSRSSPYISISMVYSAATSTGCLVKFSNRKEMDLSATEMRLVFTWFHVTDCACAVSCSPLLWERIPTDKQRPSHSFSVDSQHRVYYLKYFIDVLSRRVVVYRWFGKPAHHVINGRHHIHHFVPRNVSIVIDVIQAERPFQLLLYRAASQYRQTHDKVLQIQWSHTEQGI